MNACVCGCGRTTGKAWRSGCDGRLLGVTTRITNGKERPMDRAFLKRYALHLKHIEAASPAHAAAVQTALLADASPIVRGGKILYAVLALSLAAAPILAGS
jgi:hypothetical protein